MHTTSLRFASLSIKPVGRKVPASSDESRSLAETRPRCGTGAFQLAWDPLTSQDIAPCLGNGNANVPVRDSA